MVYLGQVKMEASLVVCLIDDYTGEVSARADNTVRLKGSTSRPVRKPDGYYVFINLPQKAQKEYCLSVVSNNYLDEEVAVSLNQDDQPEGVIYLNLKPAPNYPFPEGATLIRMAVRDCDGKPARRARVKAVVLSEDCARARLSPEGAKKGSQEISLINVMGKVSVGDQLLIKERSGSGFEYVQIAGRLEGEFQFRISEPLKSDLESRALALPVTETRSDDRGEAVVYFRNIQSSRFNVKLEINSEDGAVEWEMTLEEGKTNRLGEIRVG